MLRRLPVFVLRRVRCAMVRRARSGSRHQPDGIASASRLSAATRSSAGRSGLDHSPSMYASPAPTSPPTSIRTAAAVSWTWILLRKGSAGFGHRALGCVPCKTRVACGNVSRYFPDKVCNGLDDS